MMNVELTRRVTKRVMDVFDEISQDEDVAADEMRMAIYDSLITLTALSVSGLESDLLDSVLAAFARDVKATCDDLQKLFDEVSEQEA